jgi:hypothetical protein
MQALRERNPGRATILLASTYIPPCNKIQIGGYL